MRAIFLDRDGVINENRADHVKTWEEFRFVPGALTALRCLHQAGFHVFVVTNQAIVERGQATAEAVEEIHARMVTQVALHGGQIHAVAYCPHTDGTGCNCRKPAPGMLQALAQEWQVMLDASYMVGDAWTDMAAGRAVGSRCVLVRTGRGAEQQHLPEMRRYQPDHIAADLGGAIAWILYREGLTLPNWNDNLARRSRTTTASWITAPVEGR